MHAENIESKKGNPKYTSLLFTNHWKMRPPSPVTFSNQTCRFDAEGVERVGETSSRLEETDTSLSHCFKGGWPSPLKKNTSQLSVFSWWERCELHLKLRTKSTNKINQKGGENTNLFGGERFWFTTYFLNLLILNFGGVVESCIKNKFFEPQKKITSSGSFDSQLLQLLY